MAYPEDESEWKQHMVGDEACFTGLLSANQPPCQPQNDSPKIPKIEHRLSERTRIRFRRANRLAEKLPNDAICEFLNPWSGDQEISGVYHQAYAYAWLRDKNKHGCMSRDFADMYEYVFVIPLLVNPPQSVVTFRTERTGDGRGPITGGRVGENGLD